MNRKKLTLGVVALIICLAGTWDVGQGQVEEAWTIEYTAEGARPPVVDAEGNVCRSDPSCNCGESNILTYKYDSNGNELWRAQYDGPDGLG